MSTPSPALPPVPTPWHTYLLLQVCPAQRHPLLQLLEFPFVLCFCLHLNFALVRVEQLHLLLELQSQRLAFRFLGLVQPELREHRENSAQTPAGNSSAPTQVAPLLLPKATGVGGRGRRQQRLHEQQPEKIQSQTPAREGSKGRARVL